MGDDICLWADGTWCYRRELAGFSWMSDDFEVLTYDTPKWHGFDKS